MEKRRKVKRKENFWMQKRNLGHLYSGEIYNPRYHRIVIVFSVELYKELLTAIIFVVLCLCIH